MTKEVIDVKIQETILKSLYDNGINDKLIFEAKKMDVDLVRLFYEKFSIICGKSAPAPLRGRREGRPLPAGRSASGRFLPYAAPPHTLSAFSATAPWSRPPCCGPRAT